MDQKFLLLLCLTTAFRNTVSNILNQETRSCPNLVTTTHDGKVRGSLMLSRSGRTIYAYRGIPYAKPPVGKLRFKAPEPADPWTYIHDATKDASICMQKDYLFKTKPEIEGSEDCLYINVYTPSNLALKGVNLKNLPVLVFMPYGAFMAGSSKSTILGPEYILDKDVILVTFNYRLGIFGFYTSVDDAAPGNWALKDQRLALKWVQRNIESFGGDPSSVTIAGQSAGAGSVHLHMLSPSSKGLFHKAITQSGTAMALWARPFDDLQRIMFKATAQAVNCDVTLDNFKIIECVRNVSGEILLTTLDAFKYFSGEPLIMFTLVNEKLTKLNPEPFLTKDPLEIIQSGKFSKVPWLTGVVRDEGMVRTTQLIRNSGIRIKLSEQIEALAPQMMLLSLSVPENQTGQLWHNLSNYYMHERKINLTDPVVIQGLTDIYTDRSFAYSQYQSALLHSFKGHRPIWFYSFNYKGKLSYGDVFANTTENVDFNWGVGHCDDLIYLFPSPDILPKLPESDLKMSKLMVKFWTTFVINGYPAPSSSLKKKSVLWWDPIPDVTGITPMRNSFLHYMNISGSSSKGDPPYRLDMRNDFLRERMDFLESLPLRENVPGLL